MLPSTLVLYIRRAPHHNVLKASRSFAPSGSLYMDASKIKAFATNSKAREWPRDLTPSNLGTTSNYYSHLESEAIRPSIRDRLQRKLFIYSYSNLFRSRAPKTSPRVVVVVVVVSAKQVPQLEHTPAPVRISKWWDMSPNVGICSVYGGAHPFSGTKVHAYFSEVCFWSARYIYIMG